MSRAKELNEKFTGLKEQGPKLAPGIGGDGNQQIGNKRVNNETAIVYMWLLDEYPDDVKEMVDSSNDIRNLSKIIEGYVMGGAPRRRDSMHNELTLYALSKVDFVAIADGFYNRFLDT